MNSISVTPTDHPPRLENILESPIQGKRSEKISLDLSEIKALMGKLWIPTYLPFGIELIQTDATKGHDLHICFTNSAFDHSYFIISESPKSANMHIPMDTYKTVTVRNKSGLIILGNWGLQQNNGAKETRWIPSVSTTLLFEIDGWTIMMTGTPAKAWSEEELIKIAESMREYEG